MSIAVLNLEHRWFAFLPLTGGTKFLFALLVLWAQLGSYVLLQFNVDLGFEELVEVRAAHWTIRTLLEHLSVALDAHEVLARR